MFFKSLHFTLTWSLQFSEKPPLSHSDCFHSLYKVALFNLHGFYRLFLVPTPQPHPYNIQVFHLHGFYMFLTSPSFSFTWFLHVSYGFPFFIYMFFLHISYRPPFLIYIVFTCFSQAPFFHSHGFYRVTNMTFPDFLQHLFELFTRFSHGLVKQFTCFSQREIL